MKTITLNPRDNIQLGHYPYDEDGTEKAIRWRVLKSFDNYALLISDQVLDGQPMCVSAR